MYIHVIPYVRSQAALAFEKGLSGILEWIRVQKEALESMAPPAEDSSVLQDQIEEHKVLHGITMHGNIHLYIEIKY